MYIFKYVYSSNSRKNKHIFQFFRTMMKTSEQLIESIGGFGWYQLRIVLIVAISIYFNSTTLMVMTFSTAEPPWKCVENSTSCTLEGSFKPGNKDYNHRCSIPRSDWKFDSEGDFDSIVTEVWNGYCNRVRAIAVRFYSCKWSIFATTTKNVLPYAKLKNTFFYLLIILPISSNLIPKLDSTD